MSIRHIDHLVLAARDLGAQAEFYRRLGFTVGARNKHPWGTENHIVQIGGSFLELLGMSDDFAANPRSGEVFPAFIKDFLAQGDGFPMVALSSTDADADVAAFKAAGLNVTRDGFQRQAVAPNGTSATIGFGLAQPVSALMPGIRFFTCQHLNPDFFWKPEFQRHDNGASALTGITMLAENPSEHAEFFSAITGQREMLATSMGIDLALGRGQMLECLTATAMRFRFRQTAAPRSGPASLIAARIAVPDVAALAARCAQEGIATMSVADGLIVPAEAAFGTALIFVAG